MNTTTLRRAALAALMLAAPAGIAFAQPAPAEHVRVAPDETSTVHDIDGVRYDVPANLLRKDGVMINGLAPQPQQFD